MKKEYDMTLVVKDNALIEASYKLDEAEQRLILLAIIKGREFCNSIEQLKGKELVIHADDYIKTFGTTQQGAYKSLKNAVMNLYRAEWGYRYINKKGNVAVRYERFTQSAEYIENEALVKFKFADAIIPMLVELERNFTSYEIEQISNLSSSYSMRLYEYFMQYYDKKTQKGWLKIELDNLKFRFGLLKNEYSRMSDFKKRVLDYSIDEINKHTDLEVTYEQHKKGRVITGFTFKFGKNKKSSDNADFAKENTLDMFTNMTDKQRNYFANKLSELPELSKFAEAGADYRQFAEQIAGELKTEQGIEKYKDYLVKAGFNR